VSIPQFGEAGSPGPSFSGTTLGVQWSVFTDPAHPRIVIGTQEIPLTPAPGGGFTTHMAFGTWTDLGQLADQIVRVHPEFNPLARRVV
jgi:hypothetical protein